MIIIKNPTEAENLLKVGKFLLRGEKGIWEITFITQEGDIWTGGLKQGNIKDVWEWKMFEDQEIEAIENITKGFKVGDFVEGYNISLKKNYNIYQYHEQDVEPEKFEKVLKKGFISDISKHSFDNKIWITTLDGYTTSLIDNTVKIINPTFSFVEWLSIIRKRNCFSNFFITNFN